MQELKQKPKLGKAKEKPKSALLPRQAVHMMKEKYIKEMDQRPKGAEGDIQQAPDQVEHVGRWAADELTGRAVDQGREYAKKKFATSRGEAQAGPEPVPNGASPSAEGVPRGQPVPEYPAAVPMEYREAGRSPTAPKERPAPHAIKERPAADMSRTAVRDTTPRTTAGQSTATPGNRSEATPPKLRPQQALKERNMVDVPRTADRAAIPRTATPAAHNGYAGAAPLKVKQQRALKERPQLTLRRRGGCCFYPWPSRFRPRRESTPACQGGLAPKSTSGNG